MENDIYKNPSFWAREKYVTQHNRRNRGGTYLWRYESHRLKNLNFINTYILVRSTVNFQPATNFGNYDPVTSTMPNFHPAINFGPYDPVAAMASAPPNMHSQLGAVPFTPNDGSNFTQPGGMLFLLL